MLDMHRNVWLIDFEYTERGPLLKDIAKLETDVLFELTNNVSDGEELIEGLSIIEAIAQVSDLAQKPQLHVELKFPKWIRAWNTVLKLRSILPRVVQYDRNVAQMSIVWLRYSLFVMSLDAFSRNQKILAAAAACLHAQVIETKFEKWSAKIMVEWLPRNLFVAEEMYDEETVGRLSATLLPGRKDRGRNMTQDLQWLKDCGVDVMFCFCTDEELESMTVSDLQLESDLMQITLVRIPIPHMGYVKCVAVQ